MRPRNLQSENGVERSSLERQPLLETLRGARLGRRSSQLIPRNQDHVHRGARRSAARFTNEAGNVPCRDATVVATLHHRRRRPTVVAAFVSGRCARMTPELAEQRRFGRARKRQHDRKESYAKHDTLSPQNGKNGSSPAPPDCAAFLGDRRACLTVKSRATGKFHGRRGIVPARGSALTRSGARSWR